MECEATNRALTAFGSDAVATLRIPGNAQRRRALFLRTGRVQRCKIISSVVTAKSERQQRSGLDRHRYVASVHSESSQ